MFIEFVKFVSQTLLSSQTGNKVKINVCTIECEGWMRHSSPIFLILLFTKPNIEVGGWLYQTKTHFTHIVYQPFSRVSPPSFTLYALNTCNRSIFNQASETWHPSKYDCYI